MGAGGQRVKVVRVNVPCLDDVPGTSPVALPAGTGVQDTAQRAITAATQALRDDDPTSAVSVVHADAFLDDGTWVVTLTVAS